jgi:hypothetical protein
MAEVVAQQFTSICHQVQMVEQAAVVVVNTAPQVVHFFHKEATEETKLAEVVVVLAQQVVTVQVQLA